MQLRAAMNEYLLDIMAVNGGITIINDNSQRTSMQINFPIGIQVAMLLSRRFGNSDCDVFIVQKIMKISANCYDIH